MTPESAFGGKGSPKSNLLKFHVMKDETRIRGAAGRKVLADPRTHRYYLCLNDSENEKFLTMFEQSGMKNKAEFIFARIFG